LCNGDLGFTLHTNFYVPHADSVYAYNFAELLFLTVLPAINANVAPNKDYKENQMCCDSNASQCDWSDKRVPRWQTEINKNSNLIEEIRIYISM
jgi:hypothetical protein